MTTAADIFETSQPPLSAPPTPLAEGKPRQRPARKKAAKPKRGPRRTPPAPQAQAAPAAAPAERPRRKARAANGTRKPRAAKQVRAVKVDLATAMGALAGLKPDDASLVGKITQALQAVNKKSRARVLEAVGRIFA